MKLPEYFFSDFDGTITKKDVLNAFILNFSKGDYMTPEILWSKGKLSTQECLDIQMSLITELTKKQFDDFINSVEIDPYFLEFYSYLEKNNKKLVVLSDGFDIFIEKTLQRFNINVKIFANTIQLGEKNGYMTFKTGYPNSYSKCDIKSGCCKCAMAYKYSNKFVYTGDGLSDRCIAKKADLLFAKCELEQFCKTEGLEYFQFNTFKDVLDVIETIKA